MTRFRTDIRREMEGALAEAMVREFGDRAASLARSELERATGPVAASWEAILVLIEQDLAKSRHRR